MGHNPTGKGCCREFYVRKRMCGSYGQESGEKGKIAQIW